MMKMKKMKFQMLLKWNMEKIRKTMKLMKHVDLHKHKHLRDFLFQSSHSILDED